MNLSRLFGSPKWISINAHISPERPRPCRYRESDVGSSPPMNRTPSCGWKEGIKGNNNNRLTEEEKRKKSICWDIFKHVSAWTRRVSGKLSDLATCTGHCFVCKRGHEKVCGCFCYFGKCFRNKKEQKDTIKPSAPGGNDGGQAFSWWLIRPHWEPARDDNTRLLEQRDKQGFEWTFLCVIRGARNRFGVSAEYMLTWQQRTAPVSANMTVSLLFSWAHLQRLKLITHEFCFFLCRHDIKTTRC